MSPTLRQLRYLRLLADHRSFSRAAEAAHVTQPTLSAGIQELERQLGAVLVDRNRSGVILTAAGLEAAERAGAILAQVDELVLASAGAGEPLAGRFRLGVIPTVAPFLLPSALPRVHADFPKLRLYLREDLTDRLIAELNAGDLDAAVIALPYPTAGLEWAHVVSDELLAALPAGHRLADCRRITPEQLEGEAMILLADGHCLRDQALARCGAGAQRLTAVSGFAASSLATLAHMVGSGLGLSFLPAMAAASGLARSAGVIVRPLDAADVRREIVVCWRAGSRRAPEGRLLAAALARPPASRPEDDAPSAPRGYSSSGMSRPFVKMNGAGNDFVVMVDAADGSRPAFAPSAGEVRAIADRARGIGCDQILVLSPSGAADLAMRVWNADGGEAGACGNGARCAAWLAMAASDRSRVSLETAAGRIEAWRTGDGAVAIDLGPPRLDWRDIPLAAARDTRGFVFAPPGEPGGDLGFASAVSMGNPHVIFFIADCQAVDAARLGPTLEHDRLLPQGANVGFAQIVAPDACACGCGSAAPG